MVRSLLACPGKHLDPAKAVPQNCALALDNVSASGWHAELWLRFGHDGQRTRLTGRHHRGPLQVQRPFYSTDGDGCQVYILHPPGGVVGGDELNINVRLDPHSRALLTTPAAGKFYRSAGGTAAQRQHLAVASGALVEWLPQVSILYAGARLESRTHIELSGNARFIGWELYCLGRPAAYESFTSGIADLHLELYRDDQPLMLERYHFAAGDSSTTGFWGLADRPVFGTLLCSPIPDGILEALQPLMTEHPGFSVTRLDGVLVCRYRGGSTAIGQRLFRHAWTLLRPGLDGRPACTPRVWFT
jgi:urease accessory protein